MLLHAETPLIKIYWLDEVAAGYGVWTGLPRPEPTTEALAMAEKLMLDRGGKRWISNTEEALVSPPETQAVITAWLRRMGRTGKLVAWADIPPRSATARLVVKNLGTESQLEGVRFAQFASLAAAKVWVAST